MCRGNQIPNTSIRQYSAVISDVLLVIRRIIPRLFCLALHVKKRSRIKNLNIQTIIIQIVLKEQILHKMCVVKKVYFFV